MNSISTALEHLRSQLTQALPTAPGLHHFDVSFPLNDAFDPLAWLGVQHCYPQFYWQQRNGDEELAALGAVLRLPRPLIETAVDRHLPTLGQVARAVLTLRAPHDHDKQSQQYVF